MDNNDTMNQPLTGGGDSMSQTSQQSSGSKLSGSLLDRIRAQQERVREHQPASEVHQQPAQQQQPLGQMIVGPATPSHITIPSYGPASTTPGNTSAVPSGGGGGTLGSSTVSELGTSSFFSPGTNDNDNNGGSNSFGGFGFGSTGFGFGGGQQQQQSGMVMGESLLGSGQGPYNSQHHQPYSMSEYFHTFVMDVYDLFQKLPLVGRVVLILFLLYLVIKWI